MPELNTVRIALLSSTSITIGTNSNGTKIDLLLVPTGFKCVITEIVLRSPSGTLAGCNDVDFGVGAACATQAFLNNVTNIEDMTSESDFMRLTTSGDDYKMIDGADATVANRTFGIYVVAGATTAGAIVQIDVFGYMWSTSDSGA